MLSSKTHILSCNFPSFPSNPTSRNPRIVSQLLPKFPTHRAPITVPSRTLNPRTFLSIFSSTNFIRTRFRFPICKDSGDGSDTGPAVGEEVDMSGDDGGRGNNWTTSILLFGLWAGLIFYVFRLSPDQTPYRDWYFIQKLLYLKGDDGYQMNQVLVALWNIMGLWPIIYGMLLLPAGRSWGVLGRSIQLKGLEVCERRLGFVLANEDPENCLTMTIHPIGLLPLNEGMSKERGPCEKTPGGGLSSKDPGSSEEGRRIRVGRLRRDMATGQGGVDIGIHAYSRSKVPVWPFLLLSFFGGAYALIPYFVLWKPPPPVIGEDEIRKWPLNFLESRLTAWFVFAAGTCLVAYAGLANGDTWAEFYQYFRESKFIHAMSLDFLLLSSFAPFWVYNDMTASKRVDKGLWFLPLSLVPLLGPALYVVLRPQLADLPTRVFTDPAKKD
ncbi:hypothetical protein KSP40_PGU004602 [Platanthera guangdongensis]|uniref:DUF2834 domain-containing protein n=1 Tax=Platanthera guangdongensis TaxID=2320717 RepID=A0ABR2LEA2_9ASPA